MFGAIGPADVGHMTIASDYDFVAAIATLRARASTRDRESGLAKPEWHIGCSGRRGAIRAVGLRFGIFGGTPWKSSTCGDGSRVEA